VRLSNDKIYSVKIKFWNILIIGIIIRLALMPITIHPDLLGHSFVAYFFSDKYIFNIYEYLLNLPSTHPLVANFGVADIFIYPPLTYFTLGIFRLVVSPLVDPHFVPWLMENIGNITSYPNYQFYIFLFKLPYLFFDVAAAYLLSSLFKDEKKQKLAFILWMFNPLALYTSFMVGQLDLLPTFFVILALYLSKKKKYYWAMIALGVGGGYKMFPLLLILPAACVFSKNLRDRIKYIFVGFLPFILTILPFINSSAFRGMVFSPKSQKMLFMGWNVTGAEVIYPFILGLIIIYFISYYSANKYKIEYYMYSILLLIFSVTSYHPQWFLWLTPFIIWYLVYKNYKYWEIALVFIISWLILTLMFEPSLSYGMFYPVVKGVDKLPGLAEILAKYTDINQFNSLVRSVFAGAALYLITRFYTQNNEG
jgi:hypothetical protein